jgi:leucyl/phenylalanyl-tRNA--protein transferase
MRSSRTCVRRVPEPARWSRAVPVEPPPSRWALPDPVAADEEGLVGVGADLTPGTLLAAYRSGLFPMPIGRPGRGRSPVGWWSPDPRGVIPLERFRVSRSLRQSRRRYEIRVDTAFTAVAAACADPRRPHGWITPEVRNAYAELHRLGWAHSIETWTPDRELVGGLYGVAVGGLFAGESMYHRARDASKVALAALVDLLAESGDARERLLDVQWTTPHLASLGAIDLPRRDYLAALERALTLPLPALWR